MADKLSSRKHDGPSSRMILEVPLTSNLDKVLRLIADALKSKGGSADNTEVLNAINNLDRKVDTMSSNIDRIEKEAADMAENVGLIRTAIDEVKATSEAMKAEIAALKDQVAQGQLNEARLDAAAAVFEKADDDIDAIVLPSTPPVEPAPEG